MSLYIDKIDRDRVPNHVAIIMDGNGRWAKERNMERSYGHVKGVDSVRFATEAADKIGVKYLTLYTFSTENWNRPKEEVDALMELMVMAIERETPDLIKKGVRLLTIGDKSRMPQKVIDRLNRCIDETSKGNGVTLVMAISYSSRWEIVNSVKQIAEKVVNNEISINDIDDNLFSNNLTTSMIPDPDLLIRTGGDYRISNFLMWQISYSELYFTDTFWPDFNHESLYKAVYEYQQRERRFGKTSEQL